MPVIRPVLSATIPYHSSTGSSLSQLSFRVQSGPPVALYSVTSASRSAAWTKAAADSPDASADGVGSTNPSSQLVARIVSATVMSTVVQHARSLPQVSFVFLVMLFLRPAPVFPDAPRPFQVFAMPNGCTTMDKAMRGLGSAYRRDPFTVTDPSLRAVRVTVPSRSVR